MPLFLLAIAASTGIWGAVGLRSSEAALSVKPEGRHIQYLSDRKYGILDRLNTLSWLTQLGVKYNATVHIYGGESGARFYLSEMHSKYIHDSWSYYIDTMGSCGHSPFHEVVDMGFDCQEVWELDFDFNALFDLGKPCVNIIRDRWRFRKHKDVRIDNIGECTFAPSPRVLKSAQHFLARHHVPKEHGVYHIRRCDRMNTNSGCTAPSVIRKTIEGITEVNTWLIFSYAEPGYLAELKEALKPLAQSHRFIIEGDVQVSNVRDGDNYFTAMIAESIRANASVFVDTHECDDQDQPLIGLATQLRDKGREMMDTWGICETL